MKSLRPLSLSMPSNPQCNLIHLTLGYLALPMLCFLLGWLRLAYALPLTALLVYLLLLWGGEIKRSEIKALPRPSGKSVAVCAAVALVWVVTSGAGGFGYQNGDYIKHNAIIKALCFSEWPVYFDAERGLVYTIGYYLPAGLVGKWFGWKAAHYALFVWTWAGVCLTLLWFIHLARGGNRALYLAPLFVALSGMDILPALYHEAYRSLMDFGLHLEWGATGKSFTSPTYRFQYSSMTTLLYWVPHHALPGWLGAAVFWQLKNEPLFYRNAMLLGALLLLWSAFSALGVALLFVMWFALNPRDARAVFAPWISCLRQAGGVLLALPVVLFIASNDFEFGGNGFHKEFIRARGIAFLLSEYALVGFAALYLASGPQRRLLGAVCVLLALIPVYKIGGSNLIMRVSIPALFVFWFLVLQAFYEGRVAASFAGQAARGWIAAAILLGAATPFMEVFRSVYGGEYLAVKLQPAHVREEEALSRPGRKFKYSLSPPDARYVADFESDTFAARQYIGRRQHFFFRVLAPRQ